LENWAKSLVRLLLKKIAEKIENTGESDLRSAGKSEVQVVLLPVIFVVSPFMGQRGNIPGLYCSLMTVNPTGRAS
jgi:hypothetical protein